MIHIVFQHADVEALRKSFDIDASIEGEIVEIKDDYAVGPIYNLFKDEGLQNRLQWWKGILAGTPYEISEDEVRFDDDKTIAALKSKLEENKEEVVWIWAAQNKHDVSGYYWLMSQLKDYQGRIFILYLNNLPFINEKGGIFYPTNLFQIQPKEFVKAKRLARPITLSEFEVDPDEWNKLANEPDGVRLLEGGKKLVQKVYDYYDSELLKFITKDWQKVSKMFNQYFNKAKETTGDAFLSWRLNILLEQGKLELQGEKKNAKEFEVKMKAEDAVIVD